MNNQFERAFDEIFCSDDFKQGKLDCKSGVPHKAGASSEYTRGYELEKRNAATKPTKRN